jgi:putative DNA primase/helicase
MVNELDSYAEFSPSNRGIKVWVRGKLPNNINRKYKTGQVEIYGRDKFFTVTGVHVPGTPKTINSRQLVLEGLYSRLNGSAAPTKPADKAQMPPATGLSNEQVISHLMTDKLGPENARLWAGDTSVTDGDVSSADWRLLRRIAFYTGGTPSRSKISCASQSWSGINGIANA